MAFNKNIKHFSLTQMLKIEGDQRDFCMFIVCVFYYFFCFVWEGRYVYSWRSNGFIRGMENSGATGI